MTLHNPSDDELNAAFAGKVCGWNQTNKSDIWWDGKMGIQVARFTTSADAVLPWLNGPGWFWSASNDDIQTRLPFMVCVHRGNQEASASSSTFPRAAVIALLRAHGVGVEFDVGSKSATSR